MKFWIVDSFTDQPFSGNPAAVVLLDRVRDNSALQKIAAEFNLSETAFVAPAGNQWDLCWFTPKTEVDLCGHATLAAAHALFASNLVTGNAVNFRTRFAGDLPVTREGNGYVLDFPARPGMSVDVASVPPFIMAALGGVAPREILSARDLMFVYDDAAIVRGMQPDFKALQACDQWIIVTAPSDDSRYDCVSRFFCAGDGIDEDPVTGSAHCTIAPYWTARLGRNNLCAYQASERGGVLDITIKNDRVLMKGNAVTVAEGNLTGLL